MAPLLSPSLQAFLVGIVVPDAEVMPGWAKKKGFNGMYAELCKNVVCFHFVFLAWKQICIINTQKYCYFFKKMQQTYVDSDYNYGDVV